MTRPVRPDCHPSVTEPPAADAPSDAVRRRDPSPTRDAVRRSIADQLLEALDDLVARHRALALHDEHVELHAELIAAEVAHQLAVTRSALHRYPPIRAADVTRHAG